MSTPAVVSPASWTCVLCRTPITDEYWLVATKLVCPSCKTKVDGRPMTSWAEALPKALALGIGAALLASLLWAATALYLGIQFGLAAVAVGWLVGRAVQKGAGTRSGGVFQALAIVLTICSLAWSTVPFLLQGYAEASAQRGANPLMLAYLLTIAPFHAYALTIVSDPLTLLFVGFALFQAWRMNRARVIPFTGPHRMAGAIDFTAR